MLAVFIAAYKQAKVFHEYKTDLFQTAQFHIATLHHF